MRLARLRVDTATDYSADIRAFLNKHDGHPPRTYRETYDTQVNQDGEFLLNSLWAVRTQLAMEEARTQKRLLQALVPRKSRRAAKSVENRTPSHLNRKGDICAITETRGSSVACAHPASGTH